MGSGGSSRGDGSCLYFQFRAFPEETEGRSNSGGGPHHLRDVCKQMFGDRGGRKRGHPQTQTQTEQPQITRNLVRPPKRQVTAIFEFGALLGASPSGRAARRR